MESILKTFSKVGSEIPENFIKNEFSNMHYIFPDKKYIEPERVKIVFLESKKWEDFDKVSKMQKISEYLKRNSIPGNVKNYAFSKIIFDKRFDKITFLKYRKL